MQRLDDATAQITFLAMVAELQHVLKVILPTLAQYLDENRRNPRSRWRLIFVQMCSFFGPFGRRKQSPVYEKNHHSGPILWGRRLY